MLTGRGPVWISAQLARSGAAAAERVELWHDVRSAIERRDPDAFAALHGLLVALDVPGDDDDDGPLRALTTLESAVHGGVVHLERVAFTPVRGDAIEHDVVPLASLVSAPPPPPREPEAPTTWYELTIVDEVGMPVDGLELEIQAPSGNQRIVTDGSGKARLDHALGTTAVARIVDVAAVRDIMFPRWEQARSGERPSGPDVVDMVVSDPLAVVALPCEHPVTVVLVPHVVRLRLTGMYFDNAKAFLLPGAMHGITKLREIYATIPNARLLIVGHTNTVGDPSYNDQLSLERAASIDAFVADRVDDWYAWYGADKSWEKRWGAPEDRYMLSTLPQGASAGESYWQGSAYGSWQRFQAARGLPTTGTPDEASRRALIAEYMAQDGTSLPPGTPVTTHGCGQHFTEVEPGDDERNRRVEIFVFDGPITPPPQGELSGPGATDYPAWRAQTIRTYDLDSGATTFATTSIWIRVEMSATAAGQSGDTFTLSSSVGYEQSHAIASDHVPAAEDGSCVDLEFTDAPMDGDYTLHVSGQSEPYDVFTAVPFAELLVLGVAPPTPADDDAEDPPDSHVAGMQQPVHEPVA